MVFNSLADISSLAADGLRTNESFDSLCRNAKTKRFRQRDANRGQSRQSLDPHTILARFQILLLLRGLRANQDLLYL